MNDVARAAGVGTMTVSRVLNGSQHVSQETADRVRAAVNDLGYHPNEMARSLRNFKSRTIGLLLPNLHDTFYAMCAHALNMVAKEHDYTVLLTLTNDDTANEYNEALRMLQRHVEGLVVIPADSNLCRLGEPQFREIPVVTLDRPLVNSEAGTVDSVVTENELGARLATEHFIQKHGLRRVMFLGHKKGLYTMEARRDGYAAAMEAAGLHTEASFNCTSDQATRTTVEEAMARPDRPEGIFSANNVATRRILSALLYLGWRVPEDVGLIGFDDLELGDLLHPALSVISQPAEELGKIAGRLLFAKMKKQVALTETSEVVLPVELIIRHSCGCTYEPRDRQTPAEVPASA